MTTGRPAFNCPNCNALYQTVKVQAGPETVDRGPTCRSCGAPLPAREGRFVVKYFFVAERRSDLEVEAGAKMSATP